MSDAGPETAPERDIPIASIRAAAERIRGRVKRTPMLSSRTAGAMLKEHHGITVGAGPEADGVPRIFLKAEHLQVTGCLQAARRHQPRPRAQP